MMMSETPSWPYRLMWAPLPVPSLSVFSGIALLILGSAALVATLTGHQPQLGATSRVDQRRFRAAQELQDEWYRLQQGGPFDLDRTIQLIRRATLHSDDRRVAFSENWLQWAVGQFYQPASRTQSTEALIVGGIANCSERAQILKSLAEAAGIPCRFVGLSGHVVLEMQVPANSWQTVDVDYDIVYPTTVEKLSELDWEAHLRDELHKRQFAPAVIDRYISIFQSREDNQVLAVGQSLSPRLATLEQACRWGVWVLPMGMLGTSGWLLVSRIGRRS